MPCWPKWSQGFPHSQFSAATRWHTRASSPDLQSCSWSGDASGKLHPCWASSPLFVRSLRSLKFGTLPSTKDSAYDTILRFCTWKNKICSSCKCDNKQLLQSTSISRMTGKRWKWASTTPHSCRNWLYFTTVLSFCSRKILLWILVISLLPLAQKHIWPDNSFMKLLWDRHSSDL